jgi:hypothetical protein
MIGGFPPMTGEVPPTIGEVPPMAGEVPGIVGGSRFFIKTALKWQKRGIMHLTNVESNAILTA